MFHTNFTRPDSPKTTNNASSGTADDCDRLHPESEGGQVAEVGKGAQEG
jgi:hypothetical protein